MFIAKGDTSEAGEPNAKGPNGGMEKPYYGIL